jgi:integrase
LADGGGLYLRVRTTGAKTWAVRRKAGGTTQIITLGRWPRLSLADARLAAQRLDVHVKVATITLRELLEEWHADRVAPRYRRPHDVGQYFERIEPTLLATRLRDLHRLEIRQTLKRYALKRGPVTANRLMSILRTALMFAVNIGYLEQSPIQGLTKDLVGGPEKPRSRVLSDDEIRRLWHAETNHRPLLRFLLLTGQRIGETQRATWEHLHGTRWHIPAEHAKNGRAHWVPLSPLARAILDSRPRHRYLVFGGFSDTAVQAWLRRWCEREGIAPPFTPHDLRRTFATRLNEMGVAPHVVERILNHSLQGVMAIYNRAEYEAERVAALERWACAIAALVQIGSTPASLQRSAPGVTPLEYLASAAANAPRS